MNIKSKIWFILPLAYLAGSMFLILSSKPGGINFPFGFIFKMMTYDDPFFTKPILYSSLTINFLIFFLVGNLFAKRFTKKVNIITLVAIGILVITAGILFAQYGENLYRCGNIHTPASNCGPYWFN
jgi:hypothetical protein